MHGESEAGTGGGRTTVGATGPGAGEVADLVAAAGGDSVTGRPEDVLAESPDAVVAAGEGPVLASAKASPETPVLAVDAGPGLPSIPRDRLPDALSGLLGGGWTDIERALLDVTAGDRTERALLNVTLVTIEPARISEYSVTTGDSAAGASGAEGTGGGATAVGQFRADGVVAATPTGSKGYAHSAGGPVLDPATDAATVTPIAPFSISQDHWVLGYPLSLTVEREESAVALFVDGEKVRPVGTETPVTVSRRGSATFVGVPECEPFFGQLEKT